MLVHHAAVTAAAAAAAAEWQAPSKRPARPGRSCESVVVNHGDHCTGVRS